MSNNKIHKINLWPTSVLSALYGPINLSIWEDAAFIVIPYFSVWLNYRTQMYPHVLMCLTGVLLLGMLQVKAHGDDANTANGELVASEPYDSVPTFNHLMRPEPEVARNGEQRK